MGYIESTFKSENNSGGHLEAANENNAYDPVELTMTNSRFLYSLPII